MSKVAMNIIKVQNLLASFTKSGYKSKAQLFTNNFWKAYLVLGPKWPNCTLNMSQALSLQMDSVPRPSHPSFCLAAEGLSTHTAVRQRWGGYEARLELVRNGCGYELSGSVYNFHFQSHLLGDLTEVPVPVRFLFLLLGPDQGGTQDYHEVGRAMATLMSDTVSFVCLSTSIVRVDLILKLII